MSRYDPTMVYAADTDEIAHLAGELSALTGESNTEAIVVALRERLARFRQSGSGPRLRRLIDDIAIYPVLDPRPADQVLGYGPEGLPG